jgi:hypothetical protein
MGGTVSDVQMTCHFIGSCPAVIQNHDADLFSVLLRSGCVYLYQLFCITSFVLPFFNWQSICTHAALVKDCSHTVVKVNGFLPLKLRQCMLLFGETGSGVTKLTPSLQHKLLLKVRAATQ